jgi:bacteriorhodopsin
MFINYCKKLQEIRNETNFPSQLSQNKLNIFKILFYIIASIWNGYPISFIIWKMEYMSFDSIIICFAILDIITKGLCVLIILSYKMILYRQNGLFVKTFKRIIKVQPIEDLPNIQIKLIE